MAMMRASTCAIVTSFARPIHPALDFDHRFNLVFARPKIMALIRAESELNAESYRHPFIGTRDIQAELEETENCRRRLMSACLMTTE
jgi:hypothetical protein